MLYNGDRCMKVAVLGSGNGAHAIAFEWAKAGHDIYIYDFEPFRSLGCTIKADSLLVLEGHCEENGRFRWRTDPARTTVPSQRLPLLLRYPDGEDAGAWF